MKQQIYEYLQQLVEIPSVSETSGELEAARVLENCLAGQKYFQKHTEYFGQEAIVGDALGRSLVFGLVRGNGRRTVILTGHYDVVDVQEYGEFRHFAYDLKAWENVSGEEKERLLAMLTPQARADFTSGEWLFGRGTADMKGGLSVGLAVLDWFGRQALEGAFDGNLLFLAVPDEEAYSAGMRAAVPFLQNLENKQDLEYDCLIDLEPCFDEGKGHQVFVGSVGKMQPAVLVQGAKAHVMEAFRGLNAVGVLGEMFRRTELAPEFGERYGEEICPPPTWFSLRDRKEGYDVSVPLRASGYMSVLGFEKDAKSLMERLKHLGKEAFSSYIKRMEEQKNALGITVQGIPESDCKVMEYRELAELCKQKHGGEAFSRWQKTWQEDAGEKIRSGVWNYPQATLELMDRLLTWSEISSPVMVLAYAPPFYPAFHSDKLPGLEQKGTEYFQILEKAARAQGVTLKRGEYFCGISDLSYCGPANAAALECYGADAPLWGGLYSMDWKAMEKFSVPAMLFGPMGRDAHQMGERVNRRGLFVETPEILKKFIEQMFAKA